jgi:FixJ family two-component response regulator
MTGVDLVFVVDEDLSARKGMARLIRTASYEVRDFASVNDFLEALGSDVPGCVILDVGVPGLPCEALQAELEAVGLNPPIIIVTARDDPATRRSAQKLNAFGFFRKPIDGTALLDAIDWAIRSSSTGGIHEKM